MAVLAAQSLRGVPVPLYQDAVAAEMVFMLDDAAIEFVIAEDQEQVDKLLECRELQRAHRPAPRSATSSTTTRAACATTTSPA